MLLDEPTAGHGPRGRGARHGADQEGVGQPHHPDGRAQHERGRGHLPTRSPCCSGARSSPKGRYAEVSKNPDVIEAYMGAGAWLRRGNDAVRRPLLAISGLHAWYGESHILHGVDLDGARRRGGDAARAQRRRAHHHAEIHPRAGGRARAGSIMVNGARRSAWPTHEIAHLGIGYLPGGARHLLQPVDARRTCCCRRRCSGRHDARARSTRMFPNLKERRKSQGTRLSGGEQQMLAIGAHPAHRRAACCCWTRSPRASRR